MHARAQFVMLVTLMLTQTRLRIRPGAVARTLGLASMTTLATATLLLGCPAPRREMRDAALSDAPRISPRTLIAQSESNITMDLGAETTIRVLLRDEVTGAPLSNQAVRFGIEGNARGATLRELDVWTGSAGIAEVALVAGSAPTMFTVRASSEGVTSLAFTVSVGVSFGMLRVDVEAMHTNTVDSYLARVALGTSCDALDPMAVVATRTVGTEFPSADFANLATGVAWTIDVRGVSRDGTVTARGCVDDLSVRSEMTTTVRVPVVDRTLELSPQYAVTMSFDASEATAAEALMLGLTADDAFTSAGLLLDALDAELEAERLLEPRTRLVEARRAGLDLSVATELAARETSFAREFSELTGAVDESLRATTLEGTLVLAPARLEFSRGTLGESHFTSTIPTTLGGLTSRGDAVVVESASVGLRASTLWLTALRIESTRADSPLQDGPLCSQLTTLVNDLGFTACTDACVAATCSRAAELAVSALEARALAADTGLAAITFNVALVASDADRDFVAETLASPDFTARWQTRDALTTMPLTVRWAASSNAPL